MVIFFVKFLKKIFQYDTYVCGNYMSLCVSPTHRLCVEYLERVVAKTTSVAFVLNFDLSFSGDCLLCCRRRCGFWRAEGLKLRDVDQ